MAACLCWGGWFEVYGMMLSVKVGFLYMEVVKLIVVLWIVMSRKFICLLDSGSAVKFMLMQKTQPPEKTVDPAHTN